MKNRKSVLITGGTSGLGYETVKVFLENGWDVATCGRRKTILDHMKAESGNNLIAEVCDIRIESSISLFLRMVKNKFGKIDALVLNAADIGPTPLPRIEKLNTVDLRMLFEANLFGNFNFLKGSIPLINKGGIIVHITSDAATQPYEGWGAYSASKAGFDAIIRILNAEMKNRKIAAFSFDPGDMDTTMHHMAAPEDKSHLKNPKTSAQELFLEINRKMSDPIE